MMILILDNNGSFIHSLYHMIVQIYPSVEIMRENQLDFAKIEKMNPLALVIGSGPITPDHLQLTSKVIKHLFQHIPILAISLGHLALAKLFGAQLLALETINHGKALPVFHHQEDIFAQMPNPFMAACFYSHIVSNQDFPSELKILAKDNNQTIMAIKHRYYPSYGIQFFPESILTPDGGLLLTHFIEIAHDYHKQNS